MTENQRKKIVKVEQLETFAEILDTLYGSPMGASGEDHAPGLVPDPGETAGTSKFLREDGTWNTPVLVNEKVIAAAINEVRKKVTETTWGEVKALRDAGLLIPGMWYQITDHEPSGWEQVIAEGNGFDILVLATGKDTLSEIARAKKSQPIQNVRLFKAEGGYLKDGPDYEEPFYYVGTYEFDGETYYRWQKYEDGDALDHYVLTTLMYHAGDLSESNFCYDYIELYNDDEYTGMQTFKDVFVLCEEEEGDIIIYKTSCGEYGLEPDYNEWYEPDGTMQFDGKTYYRWKKWEDSTEEYSGYYALTDKIYYPGDIDVHHPVIFISLGEDGEEYGSGMEDVFVESEYYGDSVDYFADKNIDAWQLLFSLDNDIERFPWATDDNKGVIYGVNYGNGCEKNGLKDYGLGEYKPIDLGIILNDRPLLFADKNIGAECPEAPGLYFLWGDVEGFSKDSGRYCNGLRTGERNWSGNYAYTHGAELGDDLDIPQDSYYDAARKYIGNFWRMPNSGEFLNLIEHSDMDCIYTTYKGMNGILVTSALNNNSIFFPAAGWFNEGFEFFGLEGSYWTSTSDGESTGYILHFDSSNILPDTSQYRCCGLNIRPIYDNSLVDLGLPSGTKWATMNIGARKPEEAGLYFSWGNVDGYGKDDEHDFQNTYNNTSGHNLSTDIPNNNTYDAALSYRGTGWRIPTKEDFEELINTNYTIIKETSRNGIYGRLITSKINGKSIFIPAAGYCNSECLDFNEVGNYWSSTYGSSLSAYNLYFYNSDVVVNDDGRNLGFPIRPVYN